MMLLSFKKLNLSVGLQLEQAACRGIGISLYLEINNGFTGLRSGSTMLSRLTKEFQGICGNNESFARGKFSEEGDKLGKSNKQF